MILNGKEIAGAVYEELGKARGDLKAAPRMGLIVASQDPVIESFVRIKSHAAERLGVEVIRRDVSPDAGMQAVLDALAKVSASADGVIVQLPLSAHIDTDAVLAAIPPEKDVDALGLVPFVAAPVAGAVAEMLRISGINVVGKRAVVVGEGRLVGAPVAALLRSLGADVTTLKKGDPLEPLQDADIIVSGAGSPALITPDLIRDGVVLIDAGTSESAGKVAGDVDPACADKAAVFTPVPGGVGPVAVAMIFKNLFELIEQNKTSR